MSAPVLVLNTNTQRETGRKAQQANIMAAKAIADIIRTCLGPCAMLKMVLDAMGGIVMTNDGNAILREIDVNHPAAKSMIELSRAQDENVGDGTTSVIILAGEMLSVAEPWLEKNIHPKIIIDGYKQALEDAMALIDKMAVKIDINNRSEMAKIVASSIATKFISRWSEQMCGIALDAVKTVYLEESGQVEIDIKRYVKIEKVPGGDMAECSVLSGVMLNKDVTHAQMRRVIKNPRILLLDCPLEYKKGESQGGFEITEKSQWTEILKQEEEYIANMCKDIIKFKPDLVLTEKGLSDLAQHFFVKNGITALRRVRKTDNNRIARAVGATICHRTDEIQESDIGTGCGLFEIKKIGDEYFAFIVECKNPKACTVLLRGANKDVLNEIERNLLDAMSVVRNVMLDPRLVPGGGAIEMALSTALNTKSSTIQGVQQWTYRSVANALEVIPRTLAQNCGAKVVQVLTQLRAKHSTDPINNLTWGIDGNKGVIIDIKQLGVWETVAVKTQTIKTAIEAACLLLRVDDIVSGMKKKSTPGQQQQGPTEDAETME
jgi:T-complex protein 1 subunit gamma